MNQKLEILQQVRSQSRDDVEQVYLAMGKLALNDYWFFLRVVCGYRFLDPWDHGEEMVWFLEQNLGHPMMFLVPRGGCKSATITIPFLPWAIAKDPTLRGIITNVRDDKSRKFAKTAAGIITTQQYRACFPYVIPTSKWGEEGYYVEEDEAQGAGGRLDPSIGSFGVGGNITGSHVRAVLHDDLINEDTAGSAAEREKAKRLYKESLNCLDPGGQMMISCTRWRPDDIYGEIESGSLPGPGENFRVFKRGAERVVLGENDVPVIEYFNPRRTFIDMKGQPQEVGYDEKYLEAMKKVHGAMYYSLFQNDPLPDGDRDFLLGEIKQFSKTPFQANPLNKIGIESGNPGASFVDSFRTELNRAQKTLNVERLKPQSLVKQAIGKHPRIRAVLTPLINFGRFYIREDVWQRPQGLGAELRDFDKGDDDALDALVWCVLKAPKHTLGRPVVPYLAVDPAFTAERQSNHTAIVVGCWYGEDFYVLDCDKFKTSKVDFKFQRIMRMFEKYASGPRLESKRPERLSGFYSPGNTPMLRRRVDPRREQSVWGNGLYEVNNYVEETNEGERE